jgi:hypothetical protein
MAYYDYEHLKNQGFSIGWLDISNRIRDTTALALSKNITEYWIQEIANYGLETTCKSSPDDLLIWADQNGLNYIMVVSIGSNLSKKQNLLNEIPEFLATHPDLSIAGHILDKGDKFYELHHQCYIININWWREAGKPRMGDEHQTLNWSTIEPARSEENWHDGYTPHWIAQGTELKTYTGKRFGWNIINSALKQNKKLYSFTENIRESKYYLYPEVSFDVHSKLFEVMNHLQGYGHFVANTETPPEKMKDNDFQGVVCTSGGITALLSAYVSNLQPYSKVTIFDFSPISLALQREIKKPGFDFKNFKDSFYKIVGHLDLTPMFRAESNIDKMQEIIDRLMPEGLEDFIRDVWPTLDIQLYQHNFFEIYRLKSLLGRHAGEKTYIHLTNILHYQNSAWLFSSSHRYNIEKDVLAIFSELGNETFYLYQNRPGVKVNWRGHTPKQINESKNLLGRPSELNILPWINK